MYKLKKKKKAVKNLIELRNVGFETNVSDDILESLDIAIETLKDDIKFTKELKKAKKQIKKNYC